MSQTSVHSARSEAGKATTVKTFFSRETSVSIPIQAEPATVWALLTNAADFPRWNSTIISLNGQIKNGNTLKLKSVLDPKREFTLKVKEFEPEKRLMWGDSQGNRVYTLTKGEKGGVLFSMTERIGGFMFPLYARFIPPFDASFEQFAADLKREAESVEQSKRKQ